MQANSDEGTGHWFAPCSQRKQGSERSDEVPAFTLYTLHHTLNKVQSEAMRLQPLHFTLYTLP